MTIKIAEDNQKLWVKLNNSWARGFLFNKESTYVQNERIIEHLSDFKDTKDLILKLQEANGHFSIIIDKEETLYFAVDKIRSIPLFYTINEENEITVSDNIYLLRDLIAKPVIDELALSEFLLSGFVSDRDTLYTPLKQVLAGEVVEYSKISKQLKIYSYFKYQHQESSKKPDKELIEQLDRVFERIFKRVISTLNNQTVVIPLSGGYDSRLVAIMFKRLGYEKVICYTYGKKNNQESMTSKAVAEYLRYPWIMIEQDRKSWYRCFSHKLREKFYKKTNHLSCNAHIQDYYAVSELKRRKLIPDDSIFIPGHSADFLEGSHLPDVFNQNRLFNSEDLYQSIIRFHYRFWKWNSQSGLFASHLMKKINFQLNTSDEMDQETIASKFEEWDWQERQSKFICNSVRIYEFFSYGWRMPLWDAELMNYWSQIEFDKRFKRKLYYQYVKEKQEIPVLQANKPIGFPERIINKIVRMFLGEIRDMRYARFSDPTHIFSFMSFKIKDIFREKVTLPSFVRTNQSLFKTPINGIHALISYREIKNSEQKSE